MDGKCVQAIFYSSQVISDCIIVNHRYWLRRARLEIGGKASNRHQGRQRPLEKGSHYGVKGYHAMIFREGKRVIIEVWICCRKHVDLSLSELEVF